MVWKLFLWSSLRKSNSICLENSDLAKLRPFKTKIWPFFGKNWLFWEFLTYNFQTQLWIFLIFGMELLWISTLSGELIILCLVYICCLQILCTTVFDVPSRLHSDNCTVFTDLSEETVLFEGEGDEQFNIYREMRSANGNEWEAYHPHRWLLIIINRGVARVFQRVLRI